MTIHLAWIDTLARAGAGATTSIAVRDAVDTLTCETTAPGIESTADLDGLRRRVEALGGRLTITSSRESAAVVSCSLPIER